MKTFILLIIVFVAGAASGWFGNAWVRKNSSIADSGIQNQAAKPAIEFSSFSQPPGKLHTHSANHNSTAPATQSDQNSGPASVVKTNTMSSTDVMRQLLGNKHYLESVLFYQERKQLNSNSAPDLKQMLVSELERLIDIQDNSDFSELADSFLSIYYDDIDVLLLLARFNQINGSYLEVVDVYLLAKTYAYTEIAQQKVNTLFNSFVEEIDITYTKQQDWWSLVNFYSHINTSGLMTSAIQYQQALAHLRSGDEAFAIEQFNQLLSDSLVGESAALALKRLNNGVELPTESDFSGWEDAESIALQVLGNQYLVNLTNNQQQRVKLLIDTGASMTAMSTTAFNEINAYGTALAQDTRVFRTAGGIIKGLVYVIPELTLGPYLLKNTNVAVIDFEKEREMDGLLGMNILGQFRFQIDQENSRLLLTKK